MNILERLNILTDRRKVTRPCEKFDLSADIKVMSRLKFIVFLPLILLLRPTLPQRSTQNDQEYLQNLVAKEIEKLTFARTCLDLKNQGINTNGFYYLQSSLGTVRVQCDFDLNTTTVYHVSNSETELNLCITPPCEPHEIGYQASLNQIKSLISNSEHCYQNIKIDCKLLPLTYFGDSLFWWLDSNGNQHHYIDGNDQTNHFCACGKDESCVYPSKQCNCDTMHSIRGSITYTDVGNITEKSLLPITGFGYGPSIAIDVVNSKANISIGPLVCSGKAKLAMDIEPTILSPRDDNLATYQSLERDVRRNSQNIETCMADMEDFNSKLTEAITDMNKLKNDRFGDQD